jgi:lysophospholipase L1-like esterase
VGYLRYTQAITPVYTGLAALRNFVSEGDSITAVSGWAYWGAYTSLPGYTSKFNQATSGYTLRDIAARAATLDARIVPGAHNVMTLLIGANGLGDTTTYPSVNTWIAEMKTYCDARRAAGWFLVIATVLPQGFGSGVNEHNVRRNIVNPELRLWTTSGSIQPGKHADMILNFDADPIMGVDNSKGLYPTYWGDDVHPSTLGYQRMQNLGLVTVAGASAVDLAKTPPSSVTRLLTLTPKREVGTVYLSRLAVWPDCEWTLQAGSDVGFSITSSFVIAQTTGPMLTHPAGTIGSYVANLRGVDAFGNIYTATLTLSVTAIDAQANIAPNDGHFDSYFMPKISFPGEDTDPFTYGIEEISGNAAFALQVTGSIGYPQKAIGKAVGPVAGALYECSFVGWKNGVGASNLVLTGGDIFIITPTPSTTPVTVQGTFTQASASDYDVSVSVYSATPTAGEKGWWDDIEIRRVLGPVISAPVFNVTGDTTATVGATTAGTTGTMYAVLTPTITRPTKAQIKAGQNASGGAAVWAGSLSITGTGAKTFNASGLSAGTKYHAHVVHETAAGYSNTLWATGTTTGVAGTGHNGKKTQVNMEFLNEGGDYPWLNAMKTATNWGFASGISYAGPTPDILDADGYLISMAGTAASGIKTGFRVPSQAQRPGAWIIKWDGDTLAGSTGVNSGSANANVVFHAISAITQSGTIQTFTLTTPPTHMRAGQPIALSNIAGGTWGGLSFNNWRVLDVNVGTNSFRVNSGTTFTGTLDPLTNARATFTDSTIVANTGVAGGLNGSGRLVVQPVATNGGADGFDMGCGIRSIQSPTNYPHNIRICHQDDEAALDAGGEFTPLFLSKMANFGVLRFLDWQQTNGGNASTWNTRKVRSNASYNAAMYVPTFYAGETTTLSGATYTVAAPAINSATGAAWSGVTDKTTIHVRFTKNSRPTSTFTGSAAFNSGIGQWEITVNSGLTGFIAIGQTLTVAGRATNSDCKITGGSGSVWQLSQAPEGGAATSLSMTTRQDFRTHTAAFTSGFPDISIPNNVYQAGDPILFYNTVMPPNVTANQIYYVVSAVNGSTGTIRISASPSLTPTITPNGSNTGTGSSIVLYLNAPGTSANPKRILSEYANEVSDYTNSYPVADSYRDVATLFYDATLNAWIKHGGDKAIGSCGIVNGVPIECMFALAWGLGAHPWVVSPPRAMDPMTDWWPNVMLYDKTNRPAWAKMRIEPPNELWNTATGFYAAPYAKAKATAYNAVDPVNWAVGDFYNWYGKVVSTLGQMAYQIYGAGNLDVTYQVMCGVQTAGDVDNNLPRFRATSYVGAGTVQAPLTGAWGTVTFAAVPGTPWSGAPAATKYVSHLAVATYYTSNAYDGRGGGGPQTLASLSTEFGGIQFVGTDIVAGVLHPEGGTGLTTGMTIFLPLGLGTATTVSGSDGAGWTLSNLSLNVASRQTYLAAKTSGLSAADKMADSVIDTVVDATIESNGTSFTVHSIISGQTVGAGLQIYGGSVAFPTGPEIASGTYPNFTLSSARTPQRANFSVGLSFSLTGDIRKWQIWGQWANSNFGITKISAYEGGMSNDFGDVYAQTILKARAKHAPSVQGYATQMFDNFRGLGAFPYPAGMTGEYPSNFLMTGPYPTGGAWSMLDDIYQNPTSPQWNAIVAYNL